MATYIKGNAKEITGQYGSFFNISLNLDDLKQYVNPKGYVNITMSKRKEVGQYGDTHSLTLNEWKPEEKKEIKQNSNEIDMNDIPF